MASVAYVAWGRAGRSPTLPVPPTPPATPTPLRAFQYNSRLPDARESLPSRHTHRRHVERPAIRNSLRTREAPKGSSSGFKLRLGIG